MSEGWSEGYYYNDWDGKYLGMKLGKCYSPSRTSEIIRHIKLDCTINERISLILPCTHVHIHRQGGKKKCIEIRIGRSELKYYSMYKNTTTSIPQSPHDLTVVIFSSSFSPHSITFQKRDIIVSFINLLLQRLLQLQLVSL